MNQSICLVCSKPVFLKYKNSKKPPELCSSCSVMSCRWRSKIRLVKAAGGRCVECGYDKHPGALQFHHIDPSTKKFEISDKALCWEKSEEEIKKCVLLCGNCHIIKHCNNAILNRVLEQNKLQEFDPRSGRNLKDRGRTIYTKDCLWCKKTFTTPSKKIRFCGVECVYKKLGQRRPQDMSIVHREYEQWGYEKTGRKYGVTGKAVKKWLKKYPLT